MLASAEAEGEAVAPALHAAKMRAAPNARPASRFGAMKSTQVPPTIGTPGGVRMIHSAMGSSRARVNGPFAPC
jgi:hypothetical protein